jgi:hypothetical protein
MTPVEYLSDTPFDYQIKDFAIGAHLVTGQFVVKQGHVLGLSENERRRLIKKELLSMLVDKILDHNLAEFTMVNNPVDMTTAYRVRCYLAKDSDVKLIRTYLKNDIA